MFCEDQVRATGRDTSGVRGITMKGGTEVLGMEITNGSGELFVVTEHGYGKRTPVAEYPEQNRGGQGVYTIQMTERKGALARARACLPVAVPLFAAAVRHADTLGRAMDARCYTGGEGRTHLHAMHFDPRLDGVLGLCCIGYLIALAAVRILL